METSRSPRPAPSPPPAVCPVFWHDSTPPLYDATNTGLDTKADMDGSSEAEQSTTTGTGPSTEASWGEGGVFEPYVESQRWESTQSQSVSSSL
jgi:hypothetical protein